jgi:hypothetical protein
MKNILGTIFGNLDKGLISTDMHLPLVTQIDGLKDQIQDHIAKGGVTAEQALDIFKKLDQVKGEAVGAITIAKGLPTAQKGMLESKRFLAAITAGVAVVAIYLGVPEDQADVIATLVAGPIVAYVLGETLRPSSK